MVLRQNGTMDHQFSRQYGLNVGLQGRVLSGVENVEYKDYYDVGKGTMSVKYPAYTVWKLSLVQRIGNAFKVTAALDNLFGYKPKYYYLNSPITDGVTFQIGLSIIIFLVCYSFVSCGTPYYAFGTCPDDDNGEDNDACSPALFGILCGFCRSSNSDSRSICEG